MSTSNLEKYGKQPDDEFVALLPFYITGRLDDGDRERVEAWLATSPHASNAMRRVSEEMEVTVAANESIAPPAGALAKLNAEIEARGLARPQSMSLSERLGGFFGLFDFGDRRLAWATAMALLLVVGIQAGIRPTQETPSGYELAAGKDALDTGGPLATVVFQESASILDISQHLSAHAARIVSGPRGVGFYVVQFDRQMTDKPLKDRIESFAKNTAVVDLFSLKAEHEE